MPPLPSLLDQDRSEVIEMVRIMPTEQLTVAGLPARQLCKMIGRALHGYSPALSGADLSLALFIFQPARKSTEDRIVVRGRKVTAVPTVSRSTAGDLLIEPVGLKPTYPRQGHLLAPCQANRICTWDWDVLISGRKMHQLRLLSTVYSGCQLNVPCIFFCRGTTEDVCS